MGRFSSWFGVVLLVISSPACSVTEGEWATNLVLTLMTLVSSSDASHLSHPSPTNGFFPQYVSCEYVESCKLRNSHASNPWVFDGFSFKKSLIQEPPMVRCSNVTKSNQTEAEAEQYDGFSDPPGVFIGRPWEMAWEMAHRNQWLTY